MAEENYLIIGQGLAGTILSHELHRRQISHKVLDNNHATAATKAAAGLINPITGRRYVKSWMIEELLPVANEVYRELEQLLDIPLVKQVNILRSLNTVAEENSWYEATSRPGYEKYIANTELGGYTTLIKQREAYGEITQGLQVAVSSLITAYRKFLVDRKLLIESNFDYSSIDYSSTIFQVFDEDFTGLVFCDGYRSIYNPLFKDLPFQPSKGEAFIGRVEQVLPAKLLRDRIFITPLSKHEFWSGGGYDNNDGTYQPTAAFKSEWATKLQELLLVDFELLEHLAGVRPSVRGRKPLIGQHPKYPEVYLFNGLGTKGTSLAPYWAKEFVKLLVDNMPISSEVDINRFGVWD